MAFTGEKLTQSYGGKLPPEDRPLTQKEIAFANLYVAGNSGAKSVRDAGYNCKNQSTQANQLLKKPNVVKYIQTLRQEARTEAVASAEEVMQFLTKVMRGQIREYNGKQVSVSERSRAAIELAKRTVDVDNATQQDNTLNVVLNWQRKDQKSTQKKSETPADEQ